MAGVEDIVLKFSATRTQISATRSEDFKTMSSAFADELYHALSGLDVASLDYIKKASPIELGSQVQQTAQAVRRNQCGASLESGLVAQPALSATTAMEASALALQGTTLAVAPAPRTSWLAIATIAVVPEEKGKVFTNNLTVYAASAAYSSSCSCFFASEAWTKPRPSTVRREPQRLRLASRWTSSRPTSATSSRHAVSVNSTPHPHARSRTARGGARPAR